MSQDRKPKADKNFGFLDIFEAEIQTFCLHTADTARNYSPTAIDIAQKYVLRVVMDRLAKTDSSIPNKMLLR